MFDLKIQLAGNNIFTYQCNTTSLNKRRECCELRTASRQELYDLSSLPSTDCPDSLNGQTEV